MKCDERVAKKNKLNNFSYSALLPVQHFGQEIFVLWKPYTISDQLQWELSKYKLITLIVASEIKWILFRGKIQLNCCIWT